MDNKDELLNQQLQELKTSYQQELPEKLAEIGDLWQQATIHWSTETLSALRTCLHRISGSAGSFGYRDLGVSAAKAEQLLKQYSDTEGIPESSQVKLLTTALEQVLQYQK